VKDRAPEERVAKLPSCQQVANHRRVASAVAGLRRGCGARRGSVVRRHTQRNSWWQIGDKAKNIY
jgi:hypothetical protein